MLDVLDKYILLQKRKVFLPYLMLKGVNDTEDHLKKLIDLIKMRKSASYYYHVNIIKYHSTPGINEEFICSSNNSIHKFIDGLEKAGICVSLR